MANDSKTWRCGKYELSFDRPRIMGVLNVTPDSFSDGGEHFDPDAAIEYGLAMLDAGADIIDVGGESTRPGFTPVNPDEEARRVLPVVRALAKEGAIVSIDTRHVAVAKAAVRCGASIVNDVTGFTDPKMVEFVKTSTCGVIVMHAGEVAAPTRTHATVQLDTSAAAFVAEKAREAAAEAAREAEKPARRRRGKLLGEPKPEAKLPGGVVQPSLPFGEPEPATEPASEQETPAAEQAAAAAVAEMVQLDYVNDARYAEARAHSLLAARKSRRAAAQSLRQKGLAPAEVAGALEAVYAPEDGGDDPELEAAAALVDSRYRKKLAIGRRDLVVAALQRRGFAYTVIKEAIRRVEEEG